MESIELGANKYTAFGGFDDGGKTVIRLLVFGVGGHLNGYVVADYFRRLKIHDELSKRVIW